MPARASRAFAGSRARPARRGWAGEAGGSTAVPARTATSSGPAIGAPGEERLSAGGGVEERSACCGSFAGPLRAIATRAIMAGDGEAGGSSGTRRDRPLVQALRGPNSTKGGDAGESGGRRSSRSDVAVTVRGRGGGEPGARGGAGTSISTRFAPSAPTSRLPGSAPLALPGAPGEGGGLGASGSPATSSRPASPASRDSGGPGAGGGAGKVATAAGREGPGSSGGEASRGGVGWASGGTPASRAEGSSAAAGATGGAARGAAGPCAVPPSWASSARGRGSAGESSAALAAARIASPARPSASSACADSRRA